MIWLASFPRSGNTFFRNILLDVYGIDSSSYHLSNGSLAFPNYEEYQIVKTHRIPSNTPEKHKNIKAIYLVRDGRDALVSIAHHRKDIVVPGSNYYMNLLEAILARGGSFFNGWGGNVDAWLDRADIVIKYEDLIEDPIRELSKLSQIIDLPEPNLSKMPTFEKLKGGIPKFGSGNEDLTSEQKSKHSSKFYRRGKAGSYKDEMPYIFRFIFWLKYRSQMKKLKYW